jgi:hypothetical protein
MPVPFPRSATKISSEKYGGAKVLPGQIPREPNHEATKNHEYKRNDAGILGASQPFMPYAIERDPTMQIPYVGKEPTQSSCSIADNSSITTIYEYDWIRPKGYFAWTMRIGEEDKRSCRTVPIIRSVLQ